jgi:hypothetical protein
MPRADPRVRAKCTSRRPVCLFLRQMPDPCIGRRFTISAAPIKMATAAGDRTRPGER